LAHTLVRVSKNCYDAAFYSACMWFPRFLSALSLAIIWLYGSLHEGKPLSLRSFRRDLTPSYHMWEQRVCLSPDGDFYAALGSGALALVTSTIDAITPRGVQLTNGEHVDADILVTATGFHLRPFGFADLQLVVDGEPYATTLNGRGRLTYKGVTCERLPNCIAIVGYTNQSWTLKAELIASYLCRLVNYMDKHGFSKAHAVPSNEVLERATQYFPLQSGYLSRAKHVLPLQGPRAPWCATQNYLLDIWRLWISPLDDGHMVFERPLAKQ
jgi:monooxygenase